MDNKATTDSLNTNLTVAAITRAAVIVMLDVAEGALKPSKNASGREVYDQLVHAAGVIAPDCERDLALQAKLYYEWMRAIQERRRKEGA